MRKIVASDFHHPRRGHAVRRADPRKTRAAGSGSAAGWRASGTTGSARRSTRCSASPSICCSGGAPTTSSPPTGRSSPPTRRRRATIRAPPNIALAFNRVTKYVATHRRTASAGSNSAWLGKDPVAALQDLRQGDGPVLLIQGSSELIHALLAHDLIDEIRLHRGPADPRQGASRLFGFEGSMPRSPQLVKSGATPQWHAARSSFLAGAASEGRDTFFAAETPSSDAAELRRRENRLKGAKRAVARSPGATAQLARRSWQLRCCGRA